MGRSFGMVRGVNAVATTLRGRLSHVPQWVKVRFDTRQVGTGRLGRLGGNYSNFPRRPLFDNDDRRVSLIVDTNY